VHQSRALDLRAEVFNKEKNGRDDETMRDVDAIRADILKSLDAGIQDIEKAIDIGPANANMHRSVAQLYAEAARHGRDAKDQAFKHLAKAITGGLKAKQLVNDPVFRAFFAPDQIAEFGKIAGPLEPAQPMVRELDPLKGGLHFQEKK
jgi:hypothetical protein